MLTVGTFNLCLLPRLAWWRKAEDRRRVDAFFSCFEDWPDVLLLQEVWDSWISSWGQYVESGLKAKGYSRICRDRRPWWSCFPNSGLVVAVKGGVGLRAFETAMIRFERSAGIQWLVPRGIQCVSFQHPRLGPVRIMNVHMHAPTEDTWFLNSPSSSRATQLSQLATIHSELRRGGSTQIVGGDFNVDSRGKAAGGGGGGGGAVGFEVVRAYMWSAARLSWLPSDAPTYPHPRDGESPLVDARFANKEQCLDHFFVTGTRGRVVRVWEPFAQGLWVSDHAAVVGEL